ncbi:hypothetical protein GE061_013160 [Apolygus lucorum]|uniref:Uncharacterized protein n=1 Tax=Apolygus lucorum TaxID=248454 RepID=A0A8S9XVM3_APOLU|nr:hypothetical protein GE061_013160 [Apolygus lucorum]
MRSPPPNKPADVSTSSRKKENPPWTELQTMGEQDAKHLKEMKTTLADMLAATKKQPNISQVVKTGLTAMVELCDALLTHEKKRTMLQNKLKDEVEKLAKWSPSKELRAGSRKRQKRLEPSDNSESEDMEMGTDAGTSAASESDVSGPTGKKKLLKQKDLAKATRKREAQRAKKEEDRMMGKDLRQWTEQMLSEDERRKKVWLKNQEGRREEHRKEGGETQRRLEAEKEKEKKKKIRSRNTKRPEALVIAVSENLSYSSVLKNLREKMKPEDTGTEIRAIRKTAKGDVLLELGWNSELSEEFQAAVVEAIGNKEAVKGLSNRASIEIRDLDILATEEEVRKALDNQLKGKGGEIKIFLTKPNDRSQRVAIVEMAEREAALLIQAARDFEPTCDCDECFLSTKYFQDNFMCCRTCQDQGVPWNTSEGDACYQTCLSAVTPMCELICSKANESEKCGRTCKTGWIDPAGKLCRRACPIGHDEAESSRNYQPLVRKNFDYSTEFVIVLALHVIQFLSTLAIVLLLFFIGIFQRNISRTPIKPISASMMEGWAVAAMLIVFLYVMNMWRLRTRNNVRYLESFILHLILLSLVYWEINRPITMSDNS